TRVRATERSMLVLVVESPNAWASWTISARCSSGRAIRYLRVTRQPPRCPVRPYQPARTRRAESVTAAERPGNLPATPLLYLQGRLRRSSEGSTALDSGDTAFVLISAALVMFMIPGLALFYGGMVRAK